MKRTILAAAIMLAALAVLGTAPAAACMFDTDCYPGSTCVKASGQLYGGCVGGVNPGYDSNRDYGSGTGTTCMFTTDCYPGKRCIKSSSSLYGTCL